MHMELSYWILICASAAEFLFLVILFWFFSRLKRSEALLNKLQANQERLLAKLDINAQLEQELMESFDERQQELMQLEAHLEERVRELKRLLSEAQGVTRSPGLLREIINQGYKAGRSKAELAKSTNLSIDEVSLILSKSNLT